LLIVLLIITMFQDPLIVNSRINQITGKMRSNLLKQPGLLTIS